MLIFLVFFFFLLHITLETGDVLWNSYINVIGGDDPDLIYSMTETTDGGVIMVGGTWSIVHSTQSILLAKYDKFGDLEYGRCFADSFQGGLSIVEWSQDTYLILGVEGWGPQIVLLKVSSTGEVLSKYRMAGSDGNNFATSLKIVQDRTALITTGFYNMGWGEVGGSLFLAKISAIDSSPLCDWACVIDFYGSKGHSTFETPQGDYVVSGSVYDSLFLAKFDSVGTLLWSRKGDNPYGESGYSAIDTRSGDGYVITGTTRYGRSKNALFLSKFSTDGAHLFTSTYGGEYSYESGACVIQTPDEDCFIVASNTTTSHGSTKILLTKFDSLGYILWEKLYYNHGINLDKNDSISTIIPYMGGYALSGNTESLGPGKTSALLITVDENGEGCGWEDLSDTELYVTNSYTFQRDEDKPFSDYTAVTNTNTVCDTTLGGISETLDPSSYSVLGLSTSVTSVRECTTCIEGHYGLACDIISCFGAWTNGSDPICSGHGTCVDTDVCDCVNDYYGIRCNVTTCFQSYSNVTDEVCSGHGICNTKDVCLCEEGYFHPTAGDENCNSWTCWDFVVGETGICNSHGNCTDLDTCDCDDRYDMNVDCGNWTCFGLSNLEIHSCGGERGYCIEHNLCECTSEDYIGDECSYECFNFTFDDDRVCEGMGNCVAPDKCVCWEGYSSLNSICDSWACFGVSKDAKSSVCDGSGECVSHDRCSCKGKYEGVACDEWSCDEYKMNSPKTCKGRGRCQTPENCKCDIGFSGKNCQTNLLYYSVMAPMLTLSSVFGSIILLVIILCVICCLCACCVLLCLSTVAAFSLFLRNRIQKFRLKKFSTLRNINLLIKEQELDNDTSVAHLRINKSLFEIEFDSIELLHVLGKGGSDSTVYKAKWNKEVVAFKCFRTSTVCSDQSSFDQFEREVEILSSISHPYVLRFFGCSLHPPRVGIVMEFCEKGDLQFYLCKMKQRKEKVSLETKGRFLKEISSALLYLHSKNIIHRDIKLENVLIDSKNNCKLMDFGLSKIVSEMSQVKTSRIGTSYFMAPELIIGVGNYDSKVDVFAFGILSFIVLTEEFHPYGLKHNFGVEIRVANDSSYRPDINLLNQRLELNNSELLEELIQKCWEDKPSERPSFREIADSLEECFSEGNIMKSKKLRVEKVEAEEDVDLTIQKLRSRVKVMEERVNDLRKLNDEFENQKVPELLSELGREENLIEQLVKEEQTSLLQRK